MRVYVDSCCERLILLDSRLLITRRWDAAMQELVQSETCNTWTWGHWCAQKTFRNNGSQPWQSGLQDLLAGQLFVPTTGVAQPAVPAVEMMIPAGVAQHLPMGKAWCTKESRRDTTSHGGHMAMFLQMTVPTCR